MSKNQIDFKDLSKIEFDLSAVQECLESLLCMVVNTQLAIKELMGERTE